MHSTMWKISWIHTSCAAYRNPSPTPDLNPSSFRWQWYDNNCIQGNIKCNNEPWKNKRCDVTSPVVSLRNIYLSITVQLSRLIM